MKGAIAGLVGLAVILAWLLYAEVSTNRHQRSQLAELTTKLDDKTARENLEFQEKCALQAYKTFTDPNFRLRADGGINTYEDYESHYNTRLNKCFVKIHIRGDGSGFSESLIDAFERRTYANYLLSSTKSNQLENVTCNLQPVALDGRACRTYEDYKAFVATHMEQ
jgi:hypothetical protein